MSVIVATKEEVQEYYQSDALGQSKLKLLLGDLSSFHKEFDSSAEHFMIGSAVDCILTNSLEAFNEEYYISEVEKLPSDAVIEILKLVYEDVLEDYAEHLEVITGQDEPLPVTPFHEFVGELENWGAYILDACEKTGWQPRWGADAKLKNIVEPSSTYFSDLCLGFGKTVISQAQNNTIKSIVHSLQTNPRTASFFDREFYSDMPLYTMYYQFPIYFEYKGIQCKALLDMVLVERDLEGRILSITGVDLKTMNGNTFYFPSSVKARRYDIQAAWYTLALHKHFAVPEGSDVIKPFQFVVESTSYQGKPLNFVVDESLLGIGRYGRRAISLHETDMFNGDAMASAILQYEIKGFEQLLNLYIYHSENGFTEEREIQEAGLTPLKLNWDGII
jgi:regulator of RNase E activity RraB